MREIYDEVRSSWVAATPEEIVRQLWLKKMVCELGYPKELIAVEKELKTFPHLASATVPDRRVDIVCYDSSLKPLVLVECKAESLSMKAMEQALGYNLYVQAPYVALVNGQEISFRYDLSCKHCELKHLPKYSELVAYVRCDLHL